jgi:hypothetical protein
MIQRILRRNPRSRANIRGIRRHDYFMGLDWNQMLKKMPTSPHIPSGGIHVDGLGSTFFVFPCVIFITAKMSESNFAAFVRVDFIFGLR